MGSERRPAEPLVEIGTFERPHGVKGELTLRRAANGEESFPYRRLLASGGSFAVTTARRKGDRWLLTLEGVDSRERAAGFTGQVARVPRADLPELPPGGFYLCDLPGLEVCTEEGEVVGRIREIQELAGRDYVELEDGHLIPLEPPFLVRVELDARRLVVKLPEGMLEL